MVYKTREGADKQPELYQDDRKMEIFANATLARDIEEFSQLPDLLSDIQKGHPNGDLFKTLRVLPGKMITGDSLMRAEVLFDKLIEENAGSVGLDMETYGVYYAGVHTVFEKQPLFISIKSVSDFGNKGKEITKEQRQVKTPYATYTSAEFFYRYSLACLPLKT